MNRKCSNIIHDMHKYPCFSTCFVNDAPYVIGVPYVNDVPYVKMDFAGSECECSLDTKLLIL